MNSRLGEYMLNFVLSKIKVVVENLSQDKFVVQFGDKKSLLIMGF